MKSIQVTEGEIVNTIRSLKHKNSTGYDNISSKIIKYCAMEIRKNHLIIYLIIQYKWASALKGSSTR
jgi:hypothetical protein